MPGTSHAFASHLEQAGSKISEPTIEPLERHDAPSTDKLWGYLQNLLDEKKSPAKVENPDKVDGNAPFRKADTDLPNFEKKFDIDKLIKAAVEAYQDGEGDNHSDTTESQPDEQTDGRTENAVDTASKNNEYRDLNSMKKELGKSYSEIKEDKPPNSPNIVKWFENGGTIRVEEIDGKQVWTYTDSEGRSVHYIDGKVKFPPEAKHPIIGDISIGEFTGDRNKDKVLYLEKLEEEYGLTEIPEGYALHHDTENGVLQLVRTDYHKEFTHAGGHSMYKEDE